MKNALTQSEFLQLVGLLSLAQNHNRKMKEIETAVGDLLGAPTDASHPNFPNDHVSDAIWDHQNAGLLLLNRLNIEVEEKPGAPN